MIQFDLELRCDGLVNGIEVNQREICFKSMNLRRRKVETNGWETSVELNGGGINKSWKRSKLQFSPREIRIKDTIIDRHRN